jgi:3-deoxy-D-manno-octulosonic-acid transferase
MGFLLNVAYLAAILLALPWLLYQRLRHGKYREGWDAKFWGRLSRRSGNKPCIWLHAVSVGEVNLLEPILKRWEARHPDWDCIISTTTQAGHQLATKKYAPRQVIYCPLDFTWAVRRAMRRLRPNLLVLTELELWPNLVAAARQHGAKVAVVNGRLSEKSYRGYQRLAWLVRGVLRQIDLIAAQNQDYCERFLSLGARSSSLHITGSIKFDGARTRRDNEYTQRLARLAGIGSDDVVFLAGSTQDPEESLALAVFESLAPDFPQLRLILVPRHPERFDEVADLLNRRGIPWLRRSKLTPDSCLPTSVPSSMSPRVLLIDAVGELGSWWGAAKIAFVGGSLTQRGGQNMIEPAAYGAAVSFGPNTWNFRDVVALFLDRRAAVVVHNVAELETFVRRCLTDPPFADDLGRRAQELVLQQQGAADRTIELLDHLVEQAKDDHRIDEPHRQQTKQKETKAAKDQPFAPLRFLRSLLFKSPRYPRLSR